MKGKKLPKMINKRENGITLVAIVIIIVIILLLVSLVTFTIIAMKGSENTNNIEQDLQNAIGQKEERR